MELEPITRAEQIMYGKSLEPITREERFLAKAAGMDVDTPEPITRREMFLSQISGGGGGSGGGSPYGYREGEMLSNIQLTPTQEDLGGLWELRVKFVNATTVPEKCFLNHLGLREVHFPEAETVGEHAFNECTNLEIATFDKATSIGSNAFNGCVNLNIVELPKATTIGMYAFDDCHPLTKVDLPSATSIDIYAFSGCITLQALILRSETMCQMNLTAIIGSLIADIDGVPTGEGFIYVPSALYEDYVANFVMQITVGLGQDEATAEYVARAILRKIEDYPEICG